MSIIKLLKWSVGLNFLRHCQGSTVVFTIGGNGFGLGEGGEFQHQLSYEEPKFKYRKNCHTKHCSATFAKPVLPPVVLSFVSVSTLLSEVLQSVHLSRKTIFCLSAMSGRERFNF
jgi:hypothetical protein